MEFSGQKFLSLHTPRLIVIWINYLLIYNLFFSYFQEAQNVVPPFIDPPSNPQSIPYQSHASYNDDGGADGWGDDFDDDETASSYSGDRESQTASLPRRDTISGIQRSGTVRKSIYRYGKVEY